MSNTIFGSGTSILSMAGSLLDNGRAIYARNGGVGMSARSRALLEGFYNSGSAVFNQLYVRAENGEVSNVMQIQALRSKYSYLVSEEISGTASSSTGATVDTSA